MENPAQARLGRCYELALAVMQFQPSSETFILVHGHVSGISHAWVTLDNGKVTYDPPAFKD
jgi:hypothetical protein